MKVKIFVGPECTGKTRVANIIAEYVGIKNTAIIQGAKTSFENPFVFSDIPDDIKLLIIDDCPLDFDYEAFFPMLYDGYDYTFKIHKHKRGEFRKTILVPYLIFTTNELHEKWLHQASFTERFEIVDFTKTKKL